MKAPRISISIVLIAERASVWRIVSSCAWLFQCVSVVSMSTRPPMTISMIGIATTSSTSVKPRSLRSRGRVGSRFTRCSP